MSDRISFASQPSTPPVLKVRFSQIIFRNLFLHFPLSLSSRIRLNFSKQTRTYDGKMEISLISAKEKSLHFCLLIQTSTQGFYDRLLSRGICENAPTKGKLRRMTSRTPYDIYKKAVLRKTTRERKNGRFRKRFSAKLRFSLAFRLALLFCSGVWLSVGAKRRHLS
ncbi:unknown [Acidaminococcus sp. CAG:917]|nr:unknown [Acidaminococcus sp. CAG:917]